MKNKDPFPEETRETILEAARGRFQTYGYNKTTMAEIAKDCQMSAANLYRYFENKLDIGASLACGCLSRKEQILADVLKRTELTASDKLLAFVLETLRDTYNQCSETPKINEMVMAICESKMDMVDQHMFNKRELLVSLIEEGNRGGEFSVQEPKRAAQSILLAITIFDVPSFMPMFSLENMEHKAQNLVALLLDGLKKR